jgi:drug/metabolite transporter (DMT)-like permease
MVSSTGVMLVVAVPAAMVGAACLGLASAAQARATKEVPVSPTLSPRLIIDLLHRPLWLIGLLATLAGLGLQVLALGFGPLLLVQPLLVTALLFATTFSSWMGRHRTDRPMVGGALCCAAGLALFLLLAQPSGGNDQWVRHARALPLAVVLGAVVLASLLAASRIRHDARVLTLALATGVLYGVTAGLMKVVSGQLRMGLFEPFRHWTLYVVCAIGPIGFLLSQNTFQLGRLVSPALAVITTVDPMVGVATGVLWFGERVTGTPAHLAGEALAALLIVGGVALLAARGAHLLHDIDGSRSRASTSEAGTAVPVVREDMIAGQNG